VRFQGLGEQGRAPIPRFFPFGASYLGFRLPPPGNLWNQIDDPALSFGASGIRNDALVSGTSRSEVCKENQQHRARGMEPSSEGPVPGTGAARPRWGAPSKKECTGAWKDMEILPATALAPDPICTLSRLLFFFAYFWHSAPGRNVSPECNHPELFPNLIPTIFGAFRPALTHMRIYGVLGAPSSPLTSESTVCSPLLSTPWASMQWSRPVRRNPRLVPRTRAL